jgi:hypothetical protein
MTGTQEPCTLLLDYPREAYDDEYESFGVHPKDLVAHSGEEAERCSHPES